MKRNQMRWRRLQNLGGLGKIWLLGIGLLFGVTQFVEAQSKVDEKLAAPRATVRSFLRAASFAKESPKFIKAAISCLDMTGPGADQRNHGLLATHLEAILRSRDIDTDTIPETVEGTMYLVAEAQGVHIALKQQKDGRWLFDQETVTQIPKMYTDVQKLLLEKNKEAAALNISPDLASARATFRSFLKAHFRGETDTVLMCLDLDEVPAVARQEVGLRVANKLTQIILRHHLLVFQDMPDGNYSDAYVWLSQPEGVIELVRRPAGDHKGEWVFSRATVRGCDELFATFESKPYLPEILASKSVAVYPGFWQQPELWLRNELPDWLKKSVITPGGIRVELYELIGYPLLAALAYVVSWFSSFVLVLAKRGVLHLHGVKIPRETLLKRLRWCSRFLAVWVLRWGVLILTADRTILVTLLTVLNPLCLLLGLLAAFGLIDLVGDIIEARYLATKHAAAITQMLWPVGSLVLKITLLFCTMFRLMAIFSWDVSTLLAGLGIGGLAFALGAQDSLKNLFGSFTLIADHPFVVGETVRIGNEGTGKVEFVGLRSTRIRTADDTLLIVPNSNLTTMNIVNFGRRRYHHYQTKIGIIYSTPLERVTAFRDGIRELIAQQPYVRKDHSEVAISDLDSSAIGILVETYFEVNDKVKESDSRDALIQGILRLAEKLHIQLAFPTQTVHLVPSKTETNTKGYTSSVSQAA